MEVVVYEYQEGNSERMVESARFKVKNIAKARKMVKLQYDLQLECAEWNVRTSWISENMTEAHVFGFCRDEQVSIVLEDKGEAWFTREKSTYGGA